MGSKRLLTLFQGLKVLGSAEVDGRLQDASEVLWCCFLLNMRFISLANSIWPAAFHCHLIFFVKNHMRFLLCSSGPSVSRQGPRRPGSFLRAVDGRSDGGCGIRPGVPLAHPGEARVAARESGIVQQQLPSLRGVLDGPPIGWGGNRSSPFAPPLVKDVRRAGAPN